MAKGDVIAVFGGDNALVNYQPASGVEVVVTHVNVGDYNIYDSADAPHTPWETDGVNVKLLLSNAIALRMNAAGGGNFRNCNGVQVK